MTYNYAKMKPHLATANGLMIMMKIRDKVNELINTAGAFTLQKAFSGINGDSWLLLACIDILAEKGEIRCITDQSVPDLLRVYVGGGGWYA